LDCAGDLVVGRGSEGFVFELNEIVGIPFGAGKQFQFIWSEAELAQPFHGQIAIAIDIQFTLEGVVMAPVTGGGISADGGGEPVAAGGKLSGEVGHLAARLVGRFLCDAIMARHERASDGDGGQRDDADGDEVTGSLDAHARSTLPRYVERVFTTSALAFSAYGETGARNQPGGAAS
jgi:hypothetical protein